MRSPPPCGEGLGVGVPMVRTNSTPSLTLSLKKGRNRAEYVDYSTTRMMASISTGMFTGSEPMPTAERA
jgi:hypothetical protein